VVIVKQMEITKEMKSAVIVQLIKELSEDDHYNDNYRSGILTWLNKKLFPDWNKEG